MKTARVRGVATVLLALGVICLVASFPAAQPSSARAVVRLGFLSALADGGPLAQRLVASLGERGWLEGRDFVLERRGSDQDPARAEAHARQLVTERVDIIVTVNTMHAAAARRATTVVPIVMYTSGFPVEAGLAASVRRPGANVTGIAIFAGSSLFGKYVELLREVRPSLRELGVLWDYAPPGFVAQEVDVAIRELRAAARAMNINVRLWMVRSAQELTAALREAAGAPIEAVYATGGAIHHRQAPAIAEFVARKRVPSLTDFDAGIGLFEAGGLLLYTADPAELAARTADFIHRILRGANPADLPIEYPTRYRLGINVKTASALRLAIPSSLRLRADRLIE